MITRYNSRDNGHLKWRGGVRNKSKLLTGLLMLAGVQPAAAGVPPTPLKPEIAKGYTAPQTLVELEDGRKLNLHCMGSGKRTVLFESGGSDWSAIWEYA